LTSRLQVLQQIIYKRDWIRNIIGGRKGYCGNGWNVDRPEAWDRFSGLHIPAEDIGSIENTVQQITVGIDNSSHCDKPSILETSHLNYHPQNQKIMFNPSMITTKSWKYETVATYGQLIHDRYRALKLARIRGR
jgi:hypothetical protein